MSENLGRIGTDLLRGAKPIANELGWSVRQVFHAHENRLLPTFKIGRAICIRLSTLREYIAKLECDQTRAA